jgi:hypothetical protein
MGVKVRAIIKENVNAGEFVNKETGEVIKYDAGSLAYVYLPGSEFPDLIKLKGVTHPPKTDGTVMLEFKIRKEKLTASLSDFVVKTA